jgi:hypothetical protein
VASQPGDGRDEAQYRFVAVSSVNGMFLKFIQDKQKHSFFSQDVGAFLSSITQYVVVKT